ncbi:MAG: CalY family protein [Nocardioidaceae bacterium]|nr:CalY family protein [Nocardioidaceae bacterium]
MSITPAKKVLVPLATLLFAGAVAVGSGATFTSASTNTISSVTSGSLLQTNSKANKAIFDLKNMKPGDTLHGNLTITNSGTLPAAFSLTEVSSANAFTGSVLNLKIVNTTTKLPVYDGTFGGLVDGEKQSLGTVAAGEANDYTFTVTLDQAATNVDQGKVASASYAWDAVQLSGETFVQ